MPEVAPHSLPFLLCDSGSLLHLEAGGGNKGNAWGVGWGDQVAVEWQKGEKETLTFNAAGQTWLIAWSCALFPGLPGQSCPTPHWLLPASNMGSFEDGAPG